jgi:hypothetical protein
MYNVNYDDERFKKVENEKQSELDKYNQTYDNLINERNNFTNQQQQLVDQWENTQKDIANQNLQYQKDLIEQQRNKAEKEYQNETKASYIDYQKEVDKYGVSRENVTANGLSNSGYSESSKVDMYNTYQNRLATARKSLEDAGIEFDNAIREAQMSNNETLAQNALKALQDKLNIALEGFNYKTEQENNKLNWNNTINNNYYNRYKDVESQINYENETAEKIRQYNENMAYQKEQQRLEQERWEKEMAYQREQDAIANAQRWAQINASYGEKEYDLEKKLDLTGYSAKELENLYSQYNWTNHVNKELFRWANRGYGSLTNGDKNKIANGVKTRVSEGTMSDEEGRIIMKALELQG